MSIWFGVELINYDIVRVTRDRKNLAIFSSIQETGIWLKMVLIQSATGKDGIRNVLKMGGGNMQNNEKMKACAKCGKPFFKYRNQRYCLDCQKTEEKKKRRIVRTGETYGDIKVIDSTGGKHPRYTCICNRCGSKFCATGQNVLKYATIGCGTCRKSEEQKKRIEKYISYVGKKYGELEIIGYAGSRKKSQNKRYAQPYMQCRCLKCGEITEIPLERLKSGGAGQCKKCQNKVLSDGMEIIKLASVDGTMIFSINGNRKRNKNSSTGYTGISYQQKSGKYRAYINFKRKQYHLGYYDQIEEAIKAREEAEKKIYGGFLEWYSSEYPERWKKISKNEDHEYSGR